MAWTNSNIHVFAETNFDVQFESDKFAQTQKVP